MSTLGAANWEPRASSHVLLRGAGVLLLALAIHILPLFLVTLSAIPINEKELTFSVALDDSFLDAPLLTSEKVPEPPPAIAVPPESPKPSQPKPPEPPPAQLKAAQARQAPVQPTPQPQPEAPKAADVETKKPLKEPDLEPLNAPQVAFDESKTTKEVPKEGYLSDRNSTAADRGPKTLPRGDPFMDKGESTRIRYQERRGEGNLPALPAEASAGSVKKEGSPDAGKGVIDQRPPDTAKPLRLPLPPAPIQPGAFEPPPQPPATTPQPQPLATTPLPPQLPLEIKTDAKPKLLGDGPGVEEEAPKAAVKPLDQTPVPAVRVVAEASKKSAPPPVLDSPAIPQAASPQPRPVDELDAFKALLDGKGQMAGRGGNEGSKAGTLGREGQRGHEGDGSTRPGHDEAVSDVTTLNTISSAEEFDEARFAKKFDAKSAYVKPLARRIDGKWKAEIVARQRMRLVKGLVTVRVTLGRDGSLLDTREVRRTPAGLPDEFVAIIKTAVERAAAPKSEPFPTDLQNRETLEFEFSFLY